MYKLFIILALGILAALTVAALFNDPILAGVIIPSAILIACVMQWWEERHDA